MDNLSSLLIALFLVISVTVTAHGDEAFIDNLFAKFDTKKSPGVAALIIQKDIVLHSKGYGLANIAENRPIDASTNFFLASLSKQFTGMSIVKLIQSGQISEGDLASQYIPELPTYAQKITISQMLHHTSGLIDYINDTPETCTRIHENSDLISYLENERLLFTPGSEYRYSNTAYALLASIVERVSNRSFPQFLNDNILSPLGLKNTQVHSKDHEIIENSAMGYKGSEEFTPINLEHCGNIYGDRGIYTSLEDYRRWIWALEHNQDLGQVLTGVFAPVHSIDGTVVNYGFGWRGGKFKEHDIIWHAGGWDGARNIVFFVPDMDFWLVLLSNNDNFAVDWESDHSVYPYIIMNKYLL